MYLKMKNIQNHNLIENFENIMNSIIERNEKKDRPENDWNENKGRAVI